MRASRTLPALAFDRAEFMGKVIGVSDGDSITVLRDRTPVKIRLNGIDCPETGQDFRSRAKRATSDLAYGKVAAIRPRDTDRYGRTVADVILALQCGDPIVWVSNEASAYVADLERRGS
jgi:endonuclease YncB( thermonuclease family)